MENAYVGFKVCLNCTRKEDGCHIDCKARKLELELRRAKNRKIHKERKRRIDEDEFYYSARRHRLKHK